MGKPAAGSSEDRAPSEGAERARGGARLKGRWSPQVAKPFPARGGRQRERDIESGFVETPNRKGYTVKRLSVLSGVLAVLALVMFGNGDALTQTTSGIQPTQEVVAVRFDNNCNSAIFAQTFTFSKDGRDFQTKLILPGVQIPAGTDDQVEFDDLNEVPDAVRVIGTLGNQPFNVQAFAGDPGVIADCATVSLVLPGQTAPPSTQPEGQAQLPEDLQGFDTLGPQGAIDALRSRGYDVEEQGSQANPKLGDVSDPILVGALASGFQATAIWVSAPGQLRAAMSYDQPAANVVLLVFGGGFCASLSPTFVGVQGLSVACDRPAVMAPFTTIGGGPVPGVVFLVLIVKLGGPTLPYVLSLSS
jgi:hypothetical protein